MAIRNAAKAIIEHNRKILINKCMDDQGNIYFDLPGGGQNQFETMEEAVIREVMEETGYDVRIVRFVALAEEICDDMELRSKALDYSHRILHVFLVNLENEVRHEIKEMDWQQQGSVWVSLEEADSLHFQPCQLNGKISDLVLDKYPLYLGCSRIS